MRISFTFLQISQKMSLSPVKWLMIADKSFDSRNFQGVYVPFDCEFVYANPRASLYIMTEIYRIKESSNMESDHFGYWSEDKGLSAPTSYFYERRSSLKNHEFTATIGYVSWSRICELKIKLEKNFNQVRLDRIRVFFELRLDRPEK